MSLGLIHYLASVSGGLKILFIFISILFFILAIILFAYKLGKSGIKSVYIFLFFLALAILAPTKRDFLEIYNIDKIVETKIDEIVREKLNIKETEND